MYLEREQQGKYKIEEKFMPMEFVYLVLRYKEILLKAPDYYPSTYCRQKYIFSGALCPSLTRLYHFNRFTNSLLIHLSMSYNKSQRKHYSQLIVIES